MRFVVEIEKWTMTRATRGEASVRISDVHTIAEAKLVAASYRLSPHLSRRSWLMVIELKEISGSNIRCQSNRMDY